MIFSNQENPDLDPLEQHEKVLARQTLTTLNVETVQNVEIPKRPHTYDCEIGPKPRDYSLPQTQSFHYFFWPYMAKSV